MDVENVRIGFNEFSEVFKGEKAMAERALGWWWRDWRVRLRQRALCMFVWILPYEGGKRKGGVWGVLDHFLGRKLHLGVVGPAFVKCSTKI